MDVLTQSVAFGLAVFFILLGIVGIVLPLLPGTLLIWLTVLVYMIVERSYGFAAIDAISFIVITLISLITGLADLWLPLVGAKATGSSRRALVFGVVGSLIGTFVFPLLGTIVGYAIGILVGEYHKRGDWDKALRASIGGMVGWGIGVAIQLGGALLILLIFIWQVLTFQTPS